jgi:hypothetical protein
VHLDKTLFYCLIPLQTSIHWLGIAHLLPPPTPPPPTGHTVKCLPVCRGMEECAHREQPGHWGPGCPGLLVCAAATCVAGVGWVACRARPPPLRASRLCFGCWSAEQSSVRTSPDGFIVMGYHPWYFPPFLWLNVNMFWEYIFIVTIFMLICTVLCFLNTHCWYDTFTFISGIFF